MQEFLVQPVREFEAIPSDKGLEAFVAHLTKVSKLLKTAVASADKAG